MTDKEIMNYVAGIAAPLLRIPKIEIVRAEKEGDLSPDLEYTQHLLGDEKQNTKVREGVLYHWNGVFWESMLHSADEDAARWLSLRRSKSARTNTVHSAVAFASMRLLKLTTTKQTLIPLKNGYLSVSDGGQIKLSAADKEAGLTYCVPCSYEKTAVAPKFMDFIKGILPDPNVRDLVQEYAGYTLLPDTRYQVAQLWIGKGRNGKGTLAQIIGALHRKVAALAIDNLSGFAVEGLVDATLVHVDEVPKRIDEQRLKIAISGDPLLIDRKYKSALTIRPKAKWIVLTNEFPSLSDQSDGLWRRFQIVPFSVQIPQEEVNPMLASQIMEHELSGVFNWSLEGLTRLLSRGHFMGGIDAIEQAKYQAKLDTDSVLSWLENADPEISTDHKTLKEDVYAFYQTWCKGSGVGAVAVGKFWRRLKERRPEVSEIRSRKEGSRARYVNLILHDTRKEAERDREMSHEDVENRPLKTLDPVPF